jgi:hypothetical protein
MANSKNKCTYCENYKPPNEGIRVPGGFFCNIDHAIEYANAKSIKAKNKKTKTKAKQERKHTKQRKKELMTRSQWYNKLQRLVNQYVTKVRDVGKPCCTCGTTKPGIKYDAGHFFTRASRPDIRFELTNIHLQCSVRCNQHGSGMRNEYEKFIIEKYGQDHLDWLTLEKDSLKVQFPNWQDIEAEIVRYRKLLREHGITPSV